MDGRSRNWKWFHCKSNTRFTRGARQSNVGLLWLVKMIRHSTFTQVGSYACDVVKRESALMWAVKFNCSSKLLLKLAQPWWTCWSGQKMYSLKRFSKVRHEWQRRRKRARWYCIQSQKLQTRSWVLARSKLYFFPMAFHKFAIIFSKLPAGAVIYSKYGEL